MLYQGGAFTLVLFKGNSLSDTFFCWGRWGEYFFFPLFLGIFLLFSFLFFPLPLISLF